MNSRCSQVVGRSLITATGAGIFTGVLAALPLPASTAQAQQVGEGFTVEEIVVTSRKREESLQSAALSVTAFSGSGLQQRSLTSFNNLSNYVPNLELNNGRVDGGGTTAQIFLRGVGQEDYAFPMDPGVGVYLDGVYVSRSSAGDFSFLDIERIEVLRGPQGTLYGKNTIGGAISVITRRPSGTNQAEVEVTLGRFDRMDVSGNFDARITDKISASLAVASFNRDGLGTSFTGDDLSNRNRDAVRGQLRFQPNSSLDILLIADKSRQRQFGPLGSLRAFFPSPLGDLYNDLFAPQTAAEFGLTGDRAVYGEAFVNPIDRTKNWFSAAGTPTRDDNDVWGTSLTIDYQTEQLAFKSISAYRNVQFDVRTDPDHTPFVVVDRNVSEETEQYSQEFQVSGDLFAGRLPFIFGLYAIREQGDNRFFAPIFDGLETVLGDIISVDTSASIKATSLAAFGEFTYNITDALGLTLGGRLNWDKKEYEFSTVRFYTKEPVNGPANLEDSWTEFLPKVGLEYSLSDDILAYATYSKGYKTGGWNPRAQSIGSQPQKFDPEYLTSYEIGTKTTLFGGRATFNVAGFYSDYKEIQLTAVTTTAEGAPDSTVLNGGKARIYGAEFELNARPVRALTLSAGLGLLNTKIKQLDPGVIAIGVDLDDKLIQSPSVTFNAQATYSIDLSSGAQILLIGDTAHKSKVQRSVQNFPELETPAYWVFNGRVTYIDPDDRYEISAFLTNITNEIYLTNGVDVRAIGFVESYYSRPREWGVTVTARF